jgi:hypothetical protein
MSSTSIWSFDYSSSFIDWLSLSSSSTKMSFYIFISVILKKLDDWDEWVLIIETMIRRDDVQKYVNLITVESIESVKSSIFTFFTIKLEAIKSDDFSIDQQRDLTILRENHKNALRTYRERIEILKNLNLFILTSVNRFNLLYLRNQITIFQKLLVLKKRFALTNRIRELEMIRRYKNLQLISKRDQLNQWLLEWERVYAKTARLNLSNVQKDRCVYDFLNSLRTVNVTFVIDRETILNHEILQQEKNSSSIKNLLKKFRNHLRTIRALISLMTDVSDQKLFVSNWRMKMNDQKNLDQTREISLCICETNHRFSECLYIRRSIRLSEWISNSAIDETMKRRIFEITGKLKVILNSIRKKNAKRMIKLIEIDQSETTNAKLEAEKFQFVYSSFAT